jgi:hypothetical protein
MRTVIRNVEPSAKKEISRTVVTVKVKAKPFFCVALFELDLVSPLADHRRLCAQKFDFFAFHLIVRCFAPVGR